MAARQKSHVAPWLRVGVREVGPERACVCEREGGGGGQAEGGTMRGTGRECV